MLDESNSNLDAEGEQALTAAILGIRARGGIVVVIAHRPSALAGVVAPMMLDGPMTGEVLRAYVEQVLAPERQPSDVVVLDNLAAHEVAGIQEAVRVANASLLYLPPYSPDLNPIEQVFAKLKALLRKAVTRTKEALWTTIGELLDRFPAKECQNYLSNCGYEFT